jgi:hypothetical protein
MVVLCIMNFRCKKMFSVFFLLNYRLKDTEKERCYLQQKRAANTFAAIIARYWSSLPQTRG